MNHPAYLSTGGKTYDGHPPATSIEASQPLRHSGTLRDVRELPYGYSGRESAVKFFYKRGCAIVDIAFYIQETPAEPICRRFLSGKTTG